MKKFSKNISVYILIFALVISLAYFCKGFMGSDQVSMKEVSFSQFTELVKGEKISEISIEGTTLRGLVSKSSMVYAYAPSVIEINWLEETYIFDQMEKGTIKSVSSPKPDTSSWLWSLIPNIIMIGALVFLFYNMMNQGGNG